MSETMPLGIAEVATTLGVERGTVDKWRTRGVLPEPDGYVGGSPAWWPSTIERWAVETGRTPR